MFRLVFAHPYPQESEGGEACSCADEIPQFAPIPSSALGVNVTSGLADYATECLGKGVYGKVHFPAIDSQNPNDYLTYNA